MKVQSTKGQNAIEYLLLLALVVGIVLVAFRTHLPGMFSATNAYFNSAVNAMVGRGPYCGDGVCDSLLNREYDSQCSVDCPFP